MRVFIVFLRWIGFITLVVIAPMILRIIGLIPLVYALQFKIGEWTLFKVILAFPVAGISLGLVASWMSFVGFSVMYICTLVAPKPRIGAVLFGMFFLLHQVPFIFDTFREHGAVLGIFEVIFTGLILFGLLAGYSVGKTEPSVKPKPAIESSED